MNKTEKAYTEIFKVLSKYKDDIVFDIDRLSSDANNHMFGVKLVEEYGFDLDPTMIYNTQWQELKTNVYIGLWDGVRRKLSISDNGLQPHNETLLMIQFSSGAYVFGDDYPTELYRKMFDELKTYSPKYVDTRNNSLHFSLDTNAGKLFNEYDSIIQKYRDEYVIESKAKRKQQLIDELNKLESETSK